MTVAAVKSNMYIAKSTMIQFHRKVKLQGISGKTFLLAINQWKGKPKRNSAPNVNGFTIIKSPEVRVKRNAAIQILSTFILKAF